MKAVLFALKRETWAVGLKRSNIYFLRFRERIQSWLIIDIQNEKNDLEICLLRELHSYCNWKKIWAYWFNLYWKRSNGFRNQSFTCFSMANFNNTQDARNIFWITFEANEYTRTSPTLVRRSDKTYKMHACLQPIFFQIKHGKFRHLQYMYFECFCCNRKRHFQEIKSIDTQ